MKQTVYINGRFLTQRISGVQRYALEVLLALDRRIQDGREDADLEWVVLAPPGTRAPPLQAIEFRQAGRLKGNAWEQLSLPWLTRGQLLFSFSATGPLLKSRQVVTIHDAAVYAVPQAFSWRFRAWYKLLLGQLGPRLPLILTVSSFSRAEVVRHFGCAEAKLRVTSEGWQHITQTAADAGVLAKHGLTSKRYVLAVSNLTPNKNFGLIVKAVQRLHLQVREQERQPDFDVVVAGGVDARVFRGASLPELPFLRCVGYVSDGELRALYEHAALFVYPSLYEGFGIPAIEAMACGCPVIASNAGSLPEVCGPAARYVSPHDEAELTRVIGELMADPAERERMSDEGRRWAARYSWDESARLNAKYVRECVRLLDAGKEQAASLQAR